MGRRKPFQNELNIHVENPYHSVFINNNLSCFRNVNVKAKPIIFLEEKKDKGISLRTGDKESIKWNVKTRKVKWLFQRVSWTRWLNRGCQH